jgi:hypothetical protein
MWCGMEPMLALVNDACYGSLEEYATLQEQRVDERICAKGTGLP